jgi:hypothetical protein
MGKAKRLGSGSPEAGLALEYVRTRKVVRLLGWLHTESLEPVEVPVDQFCRRLGIDPRDLGAPRHYLLFAGSHARPRGGLRDLAGTFSSEERAWAAFRALRQAQPAGQGWAELAAVDALGQVNQMGWFGLHRATDAAVEVPARRSAPGTGRRRGLRRMAAAEAGPDYLRAVTPS